MRLWAQISIVLLILGGGFVSVANASVPEEYVVRSGDTVTGIARRLGVSPVALLAANPTLAGPEAVRPGAVLAIPQRRRAVHVRLPVIAAGRSAAADFHAPIKALYISYHALGHDGLRSHVQELLETTELNAVVIDVKGDHGFIPYRTEVPLAGDVGAQPRVLVDEWDTLMDWFDERGIYTIARIVVFKDHPLATGRAEWAVVDAKTQEPWRDREGLAWADPFREEVWGYNLAIALEAAGKGFDEIQFDYVRFPAGADLKNVLFAQTLTEENRRAAIAGFLERARAALEPTGVRIAADVFGYVTWREDDTGIGQVIEEMAPHIDVLSPMLYPSTFHAGLPGFPVAVPYPYETVHLSTLEAVRRLEGTGVVVRPWIQDFPDYAYDKRVYTPADIQAQMTAALDAGAEGWMLWDPRNRYTLDALEPTAP